MKETLNRTMLLSQKNMLNKSIFSNTCVIARNEAKKQSHDEIAALPSLTHNM
jgi:hypothetical protein